MTKRRITDPITDRIRQAGKQTQGAIGDIWSRMAIRSSTLYTQFEKVESHLEKGRSYDAPIGKRIANLNALFGRGATTNELIIGAIAELVAIISDQAEEYSEAQIDIGLMQADMQAQKAETERASKIAIEGRQDAANVAMVGQELELFTLRDVETIGVNLVKVDKPKYTQALIDTDEATWLALSAAFEAARKAREG